MNLYWNSSLSDNVYQEYPYVILFHSYVAYCGYLCTTTPNKQRLNTILSSIKSLNNNLTTVTYLLEVQGTFLFAKYFRTACWELLLLCQMQSIISNETIMVMFSKHNIMMPQSLQLQYCQHQLCQNTEHYWASPATSYFFTGAPSKFCVKVNK